MVKITKCFEYSKNIIKIAQIRYKSNNNDCSKFCPPSYHCKRPPVDDDIETCIELCKKERLHPYFKCHTSKTRPETWRNILFFICIPLIILQSIKVFYLHPQKCIRPKYVEYEYLRIRKTPFPWHPVKTLFHNPRTNALPGGYEVNVPEDEECD